MTESTKTKHVTKELSEYYYLPDDNQHIVQVVRGCGNNLHQVINVNGEQYLVSMPTKFRQKIWIKRGDYLIVTPIKEGNKVRAEIHSILLKHHIRYLKEQNKWPKEFSDRLDDDLTKVERKNVETDSNMVEPNTNRKYYSTDLNKMDEEESDTDNDDGDDD